jgi:small subunit ribosomal protein S7e
MEKGQVPNEFEESVAQALFHLESTNTELKSKLLDLFTTSAKEVGVPGNCKGVIIHLFHLMASARHLGRIMRRFDSFKK